MSAVGFVGLGSMGRRMALNIVRSGRELVVHDLDPRAVEELVAAGATAATGIPDLVGRCEVLFTSLPGPKEVEQVVLGEDGILAHLRPGTALFDLSTSSRELSQRIAAAFAEVGGSMSDAPISGGPPGAASGDLAIWVGGDRAVFDRHLELLRVVGRQATHVGEVGAGTVVKLCHNMMGFTIMETLAEVFSVGVKAGIDPLEFWQALRLGSAGNRPPLDLLVNQFLPGSYDEPAFALRLAYKDVALGTGLAEELGVPLRLVPLARQELAEAMDKGYGDRDARSFLTLQTDRAGVAVAVDPERIRKAVAES